MTGCRRIPVNGILRTMRAVSAAVATATAAREILATSSDWLHGADRVAKTRDRAEAARRAASTGQRPAIPMPRTGRSKGASAMKDDNFPGRRPGGCSGRCPRVFDPVGAKPAGPLRRRLVGKADGRRPAPVGCPDLRQPSPTRPSVIAPATRVRGGTPSPLIVVSGRPTFARSDHAAGERAGAIVPSRRHAQ